MLKVVLALMLPGMPTLALAGMFALMVLACMLGVVTAMGLTLITVRAPRSADEESVNRWRFRLACQSGNSGFPRN